LGDSSGISQAFSRVPSNDSLPKGLLEIAVGGDLEMTKSRIVTKNGANIAIHGLTGTDRPVGGRVNVGTNERSTTDVFGNILGVVTLRGGDIDITATDNVEVNASRVATFGGGDIRLTSTQGSINAGSGGRDERVEFVIEEKDENGNVLLDPRTGEPVRRVAYVPGSGIFTFHPDDPDPLPSYPPPPQFTMSPELQVLQASIVRRKVLGREVPAALEAEYNAQLERDVQAWADQYAEIIANFVQDWQLGSIVVKASEGDVIVPPAGIRGKNITIEAKNLDLQGGEIIGNVTIDVDQIVGNQDTITGPLTGNIGGNIVQNVSTDSASSLGGLSGTTGSLSTTASAVTTVAETVSSVEEKATDQRVASAGKDREADEDSKKNKKTGSVRLKRGVTIEVEVKEEKSE
jgi:hypothetical protein